MRGEKPGPVLLGPPQLRHEPVREKNWPPADNRGHSLILLAHWLPFLIISKRARYV